MQNRIILVFIIFLCSSLAFGQSRYEHLGNKYYEEYSYDRAIKYFESVKEKDTEVQRKLAISYFKLQDFDQSEWFYTQVVNSKEAISEDFFNYSQVLAMQEKYPESVRWMTSYHERKSGDAEAARKIKDPQYYLDLIKEDNGYKITSLDINSEQQDFGTSFYGDDVVFTSSRTGLETVVRRWNWNQLGFLDIYKAKLDTATYQLSEPTAHHKKFNKKYHEGPATFNEAGDIMIFTSNNYSGRSSKDEVTLEMFESRKENGKWGKPVAFPYNNKEFSIGHGSLTKDGNTLYFVSDMPGSIGGTDIYRSHRGENGEWTEPEHLGEEINTEANEMFPYIHPDTVLFFASNGHPGLGGLDIFYIDTRENGLNKTVNMNSPVNSSKDDFAFIMNEGKKKGFFSSNRIGGLGDDDIYAFHRDKSLKFNQLLRGKVIDELGHIVPFVKVLLYDIDGTVLGEVVTDDKGDYKFELKDGKSYNLMAEKEGHSLGLGKIETDDEKRDYIQDLMILGPNTHVDLDLPINTEVNKLGFDDNMLVYSGVFPDSPGLSLHSMVRDMRNGEPLSNAQISLYDKSTGEETVLISPATGDNTWYLDPKRYANSRYSVRVIKDGYYPMEFDFDTSDDALGQYSFMTNLIPMLEEGEEINMNLADIFSIDPIYFDLDKHNIRPDAALELNKVVDVLHQYPNMVLELSSHTDCRASKGYNNRLSNSRAKATARYIRERIEVASRITGKGLGEEDLVNDCECEGEVISDCSEEEHQRNRRTEFRIVKM
jgi:outer membrane protein OmpA-like peptidoglycan-associated protein/tetratricopeptide (TPR) repeat protein